MRIDRSNPGGAVARRRGSDGDSDMPSPRVLRDYAFIADGFRGGLIDSDGRLAWMCFPGWADPAVCAGLLGSGGEYQVVPQTRFVPGGLYEDGTLIWHSRWVTEDGFIDSREALAYPGEESRAIFLRRVTAVEARGLVCVRLALASDYGRRPLDGWRREADAWMVTDGVISARWTGAATATVEPGRGHGETLVLWADLDPGESLDLVLEIMMGSADGYPPVPAPETWDRTEKAWRAAVPACTDMVASADVRRSLAVLRGMTGPEGGTVAASTTSLPERSEAGRNYDYRYCWIRDICYIGHAGAAVEGGEPLLDDAVRWVTARLLTHGSATSPAYLADGEPIPEEEPLGLPGYPGGFDVRGNRVRSQFQLDLFGEALLLLANASRRDRLDADGSRAAELAIGGIEQNWKKPESGLWETEPARWTHSQLICVAGLRAVAASGVPSRWTARALSLADHMLSEADRTSLHPTGRWKRRPDDDRVDASLLLAEIRGAVPPDDPRSGVTRQAVLADLAEGGFLYRYGHPGQALGQAEGAFLICNFWMAMACTGSGDPVSGARWFERGRGACGSPGIFSEEFDVEQRQLRGNFPPSLRPRPADRIGRWTGRGRERSPVVTIRGDSTVASDRAPDAVKDGRRESEAERDDRNLAELLQELRVAGLGVQVLFGFLLSLPFTVRFVKLSHGQRQLYVASLLFAALSTALLCGPVAYHRLVFRRHEKGRLLRAANAMALAGLASVGLAISSAVLLVVGVVEKGAPVPIIGGATLAAFVVLWFAFPLSQRVPAVPPGTSPRVTDAGGPGSSR